jgi:hypothetical protein
MFPVAASKPFTAFGRMPDEPEEEWMPEVPIPSFIALSPLATYFPATHDIVI